MWVRVEFTHLRGVRLGLSEQHPRGIVQGEIISYAVGPRAVDAIALKRNFHAGADLAVMYRPRLVSVGEDLIRLSGLERYGEPPSWVHQEWICRLQERPADVPGEPSRARRP